MSDSTSLNTKKGSQLQEAKAEVDLSKITVPEEISAVLQSMAAESEAATLTKLAQVMEEESCTMYYEIAKDSEKAQN